MKTRKIRMSFLFGLAALVPFSAFAQQVEAELALPGIAGTDTIGGISDLLPIDHFTFSGNTTVLVTRPVDVSSPLLEQAVVTGRHFNSANIYLFDSVGGAPFQAFEKFTFSNVTAASFQLLLGGGLPSEQVGFAYTGETASPVPEPHVVWLMLFGLGGLGLVLRRRLMPVIPG